MIFLLIFEKSIVEVVCGEYVSLYHPNWYVLTSWICVVRAGKCKKIKLKLDQAEFGIIINGLVEFKNKLIREKGDVALIND